MPYRDESFGNPGAGTVLATLKRLVSGPAEEPQRGPAAIALLEHLEHLDPPPAVENEQLAQPTEGVKQHIVAPMHCDPVRQAAMNQIRRLRIRAY
jgi:hypothetical protein